MLPDSNVYKELRAKTKDALKKREQSEAAALEERWAQEDAYTAKRAAEASADLFNALTFLDAVSDGDAGSDGSNNSDDDDGGARPRPRRTLDAEELAQKKKVDDAYPDAKDAATSENNFHWLTRRSPAIGLMAYTALKIMAWEDVQAYMNPDGDRPALLSTDNLYLAPLPILFVYIFILCIGANSGPQSFTNKRRMSRVVRVLSRQVKMGWGKVDDHFELGVGTFFTKAAAIFVGNKVRVSAALRVCMAADLAALHAAGALHRRVCGASVVLGPGRDPASARLAPPPDGGARLPALGAAVALVDAKTCGGRHPAPEVARARVDRMALTRAGDVWALAATATAAVAASAPPAAATATATPPLCTHLAYPTALLARLWPTAVRGGRRGWAQRRRRQQQAIWLARPRRRAAHRRRGAGDASGVVGRICGRQ